MGAYEDRVQEAELKHIADGIRKDYVGQIPDSADPRDIIAVHRSMHAPDMDPTQYVDVLRQAYGQDFKAPDRTLGENISHVGEVVGSVAKAIPGAIKDSFTAPIRAGEALGESVATSNQRAQDAQAEVSRLRALPRGGALMQSAHERTVPTAMQSQDAMMQKEQALQQEGTAKSAEGLATILTLPLGGEAAELTKGASVAVRAGVGALEGAGLTNAYGATQQGLQAQFEGKPAGEIYKAITAGLINPTSAAAGAVIGGGLSGLSAVLGDRAVAKKTATEVAAKISMKNEMLSRFVNEVTPAQIKSRFADDLNEGVTRGATPDVIARVILSKLTEDAPEAINPATVEHFSEKVAKQIAAEGAVAGEMPAANLALPPSEPLAGPPQLGQPVLPGAPMEPAPVDLGGPTVTPTDAQGNLMLPGQPGPPASAPSTAPMVPPTQFTPPAAVEPVPGLTNPSEGVRVPGHEPPAVQGPLGERTAPFEPPSGVRRIKTEGIPEPTAVQPKRPQGNDEARSVVSKYTKKAGFPERTGDIHPPLDAEKSRSIARLYENLKDAEPGTPEYEAAKKSYSALNQEIDKQYKDIVKAGFKIEFTTDDPYKSSAEMREDVAKNRRLKVFKSDEQHHPFMTAEQTDKFRAVHDFFGHAAEGFEFGPRGEDAAYRQHAATLSNASIPALTTETRGQNSWVNFSPENEGLAPKDRPFAKQKFGLLPRSTYDEVLHSGPAQESGKTGNKVADNLNKMATEAKKRIEARKGGKLTGEVGAVGDLTDRGPQDWVGEDLKDHALVLASDIFTRGLRTKRQIAEWLTSKYGEAIQPHIDTLTNMAQKHIERMFGDTNNMKKKLTDLLDLKESGRHGMNWYENTANWVHQNFGEDGDMMLRFLAVTSANGQTESGAAMALKAFAQWKSGKPFTGFRGPSMVGQLERISRGENLGEHTKIENFYRALKGDHQAVVLDRWMMDAIGVKDRGGALRENDYKLYEHAVRDLAEQNGMTPRQFQAAVWEGARVRKAHITEAQGGRALTTKSGSARPLEDLISRHLGFADVGGWVKDNQLNLSKMENLYNGLKPVREGKQSGFTFNPSTFAEDRTAGHVVTLATTVIDRKKFYPAELLKFRNNFKELIANPQGHHLTLGVYDMGDGKYSVDLNASMQDKDAAINLGFKNRQREIGHFDEQGNYEGFKTGYDEAKHGKQFLPPEKRSAQPAWYKQQQNRLRTFLSGQAQLDFGSPEVKQDNKVQQSMVAKLAKVAEPVTPKDTFDTGRRSGDPVWMSPDGKLFRGKSHEDVSSKVAKAAGMTEKKTGYKGSSRWDNHAMLQQGFARIQMFPDRMAVQVVGEPSGPARSTLNTLAKGRKFIGVVSSHAGDAEHGPYETPAKLFGATSGKD